MSDRNYPARICDVEVWWQKPEADFPEALRTVYTLNASKGIAAHLKQGMAYTGWLELRTTDGVTHLIPAPDIKGIKFTNERLAEVIDEETGEVTPNE